MNETPPLAGFFIPSTYSCHPGEDRGLLSGADLVV